MSSINIKNKDMILRANQKIYFAGKSIYSNGTNLILDDNSIDDIIAVSGTLQTQIDELYLSLATVLEESGNHTLSSGIQTAYIEFNELQDDLDYRTSAIVTNSGTTAPTYIGCSVYNPTLSGVNILLSTTTDSTDYGIDWSIIRTT